LPIVYPINIEMLLVYAGLRANMSVADAECWKYGAADGAVDRLPVVGVEVADELGDVGKGDAVVGARERAGEGVIAVNGSDKGCGG